MEQGYLTAEFSMPRIPFCYLDSLTLSLGNQYKHSHEAGYQLVVLLAASNQSKSHHMIILLQKMIPMSVTYKLTTIAAIPVV